VKHILIHQYIKEVTKLLLTIETKEKDVLKQAAEKVSKGIQHDGIIHLFGCGHSHILTEEVYYRAGGLVPIHPILHEPLMLHEGAIRSSKLERENDYASNFIEEQDIRDQDIVIVISTSGRNPVPIDVALFAKGKGAFVIGITSIVYSTSQPSRHKSGKHLYHVVDLVINNHAPKGDALLTHEKVLSPFSPSSTVVGAAILHAIFAEVIVHLAYEGVEPPILLSGNVEGSDDHNHRLISKYSDRIKL